MFLRGGKVKKIIVFALLLPALALAIYDMDTFDVNHWRTTFLNHGPWGYDPSIGTGFPGGSWPQPLHNCYVFGAGTWLGAVVGSSPPETLTTMFYNPNSAGSEGFPSLCRYWREGTGDARDRIYKYPGDWPPPASRFPMAPQVPRSDMDLWCCYCDSAPENHVSPGRPLGFDVYQTVYGFDDSLAQDFFFLKYELANCSGDSLRRAFFGPVLDVDIGDAADDLADVILDHVFTVGQETIGVRDLVFAFDNNNMENPGRTWESGTPGTVAIALLAAPDSLGLTAFKRFSIDIDPVTDADQYLTLAGYDYRTGVYKPYDSTDNYPADKRFVMPSGPFDIAPDSTVTFWYAVIGSPFGTAGQPPSERDTSDLVLRYKWALEFWRRLYPGIQETMNDERGTMTVGPTIVRGVLNLQSKTYNLQSEISLLDVGGRKVMALRPGANDINRLSPGVYFVREGHAQAHAQAIRKVIISD